MTVSELKLLNPPFRSRFFWNFTIWFWIRSSPKHLNIFFIFETGNEEFIKKSIENTFELNVKDDNGQTPLFIVAEAGKTLIHIKILLKNKCINWIDYFKIVFKIILDPNFAFYLGNSKIVQLLVNGSADVNVANNNGSTPLHIAAQNGKWYLIKLVQHYLY